MGRYLFNFFRVIMAVLMGAGLLAALEISVFKEHASPMNWTHIAISASIVVLVLVCRWDTKNFPRG